jgi:hypothetical protein
MAAKLGVLIIHGVGGDREKLLDSMKNMERDLKRKFKACGADPGQVVWQCVEWDHVLKKDEDEVYNRFSRGEQLSIWSIWGKLRKFVMSYIADALAYRPVPNSSGQKANTYDKIHGVVHEAVTRLKTDLGDDDKPVIVIAHSMGSVIMSNYIWDRQKKYPPEEKDRYGENSFERMETLAGFITFGSPLSLFALAFQPRISFEFPPKALPEYLTGKVKWLNFYDSADVLAWPLKELGGSYRDTVTDRKLHIGWTPRCHTSYWTKNNFTREVAKYISDILKACP